MFKETRIPRNNIKTSRKNLAIHLIQFRKENNLSREELSFRCNISSRQFENIELCKCSITIDTLDRISSGTNISPADLLKNIS